MPPIYPHTVAGICRRKRSKGFEGAGVGRGSGHDTTSSAYNGRVVVGGGVCLGKCCSTCAEVGWRRTAATTRMAVGGGNRWKRSFLIAVLGYWRIDQDMRWIAVNGGITYYQCSVVVLESAGTQVTNSRR